MAVFVLGNGNSRGSVDLDAIKKQGKIYGCNALYRTFIPDVLVATDTPISQAIQRSGYAKQHVFYTRRPIPDLGALKVPQPWFGYSSGPIAAAIAACVDQNYKVYLLGFDMSPAADGKINNLYAGTEFYRPKGATPIYTGNWIKQLLKVFHSAPHTEFVRVQSSTCAQIKEFVGVANYKVMALKDFLNQLNTKKDL